MSSTAYVPLHRLDDGHSSTVNALVFSPDGMYLASGSDDETVIVWNATLGRLLYRCFFDSPVDSLLWNPVEEETVILGCQSGTLKQIRNFTLDEYESYDIRLGSKSHVYCLDYHPHTRLLAVGMGTEVHITREASPNKYSGDTRLPHPHDGHVSGDTRDRAVALRFNQSGRQLIVTYLNHGIRCYNIKTGDQVWRISSPPSHSAMGDSALSPDFRNIAVHNFRDGVHVYRIGGFDRLKAPRLYPFNDSPNQQIALQVSFAHEGHVLVCGSSTGSVCIWEVESGDFFQQLDHNGSMVMTVAACRHQQYGYIATGSVAQAGAKASIRVWRAKMGTHASARELGHSRDWGVAMRQPFVGASSYLPSKHDIRTAFLTSIFMAVGVLLAWTAKAICENVPWLAISDSVMETTQGVLSFSVTLGSTGWSLAVNCWNLISATCAFVFRFMLRWARIKILEMLGIPPYVLNGPFIEA